MYCVHHSLKLFNQDLHTTFLGGGGNLLRPQQCDQHLAEHNMHSFALSLILSLINCANVCKIKHNLILKENYVIHDNDNNLSLLFCSCSAHQDSSPYPTVMSATLKQAFSKWFLLHLPLRLHHHPTPQSTSSTATSGSCVSNSRASPASLRPWALTFVPCWWHHCTPCWRKPGRRHCWSARRRWAPCGTSVRLVDTPPWRSWSMRTPTICSMTYHLTCRGSASIHR